MIHLLEMFVNGSRNMETEEIPFYTILAILRRNLASTLAECFVSKIFSYEMFLNLVNVHLPYVFCDIKRDIRLI